MKDVLIKLLKDAVDVLDMQSESLEEYCRRKKCERQQRREDRRRRRTSGAKMW